MLPIPGVDVLLNVGTEQLWASPMVKPEKEVSVISAY
jgi:hypothetical protein